MFGRDTKSNMSMISTVYRLPSNTVNMKNTTISMGYENDALRGAGSAVRGYRGAIMRGACRNAPVPLLCATSQGARG